VQVGAGFSDSENIYADPDKFRNPFTDESCPPSQGKNQMTDAVKDFTDGQAAYDAQEWSTAMNLLKPLADQGHADAMMLVGDIYHAGRAVKQDPEEAKKWWHRAIDQYRKHADRGDTTALMRIARYFHYWSAEKDLNEANNWYRKAADQGSADAMWAIGNLYRDGLNGKRDDDEAAKWWSKAIDQYRISAEEGDVAAQETLARCYQNGWSVKPDRNESIKWYRMAAEQGDADAQSQLGFMLFTAMSLEEANELARKAADGAAHARWLDIYHDLTESIRWLHMAAKQGHAPAQVSLGQAYASGHGVPQDYAEAAKWWRKAGEQNHDMALDSLGKLYAEGKGVPQDFTVAVDWWRRAAGLGSSSAQLSLAQIYKTGRGVPQDNREAYFWHTIATYFNSKKEYEKARDDVEKLLTPEQVEAVKKRISEWKQTKAGWQRRWIRRKEASKIISFLR